MVAQDIEIRQFTCLSDNYGFFLNHKQTGKTVAIDVPDAQACLRVLDETGWTLSDILITHHHWDHVQGLEELKEKTGARVAGPALCRDKITALDVFVEDGEELFDGRLRVRAIATPGHTLDQISWYFPELKIAHTGDTLFSLGCGRVFEGSMEMMWESLHKLMIALPPETMIFCGHEYTQSNAGFALTIEPDNMDLLSRVEEVQALRDAGKPTLPTIMEAELATNPFLRVGQESVRKSLDMMQASDAEVFAEIRRRKDKV